MAIGRVMPPPRKDICDCGVLERMADDPAFSIEFDPALNEYHITCQSGGYSVIYYCPFCGGRTPKSKRTRLLHRMTAGEKQRL
jgi:predicted nucleic acid binding AN1-type Zn finger protein